jgi:hypothetical protein
VSAYEKTNIINTNKCFDRSKVVSAYEKTNSINISTVNGHFRGHQERFTGGRQQPVGSSKYDRTRHQGAAVISRLSELQDGASRCRRIRRIRCSAHTGTVSVFDMSLFSMNDTREREFSIVNDYSSRLVVVNIRGGDVLNWHAKTMGEPWLSNDCGQSKTILTFWRQQFPGCDPRSVSRVFCGSGRRWDFSFLSNVSSCPFVPRWTRTTPTKRCWCGSKNSLSAIQRPKRSPTEGTGGSC